MDFYTGSDDPRSVSKRRFPCIQLIRNTWDDYGMKTLHQVRYRPTEFRAETIGDVKIFDMSEQGADLPKAFSTLPLNFACLGQDLSYYRKLKALFPTEFADVAMALNDVVFNRQILEAAEPLSGFRNSLIRFNDAKLALREAPAVLQGDNRKRSYRFKYKSTVPGAEIPISASFDLSAKDKLPGRVIAIIGRNGVGKTQFLAKLALDLATPQRMSAQSDREVESNFDPARPLFSRVIALSFSAFDRFKRPEPKEYFSYIYCGVRGDRLLSQKALDARHLSYLKRIKDQSRELIWEDYVEQISVDGTRISIATTIAELESGDIPTLSSGQSILTYFISAAVAYLTEDSLILFDEPEIHLHPNAVSTLMGILQSMLKHFDSYAIVATHSPVVIQDVPSKRVIQFQRDGDITTASELIVESFGENISELTRQVFETVELPSFYQKTLKKLARTNDFDAVSELFGGRLSLHASAYLASLYVDE